jgi:hypothetical protein
VYGFKGGGLRNIKKEGAVKLTTPSCMRMITLGEKLD